MLKKLISKFLKQGDITEHTDGFYIYHKLFDRSIVDKAAAISEPGRLPELIANEIGVSLGAVLDTISSHLQIPRVDDVFLPKEDFLNSFNSTFDAFKDFAAVPQPSSESNSYRIVIADPALVSIEAFRLQGIEVFLGDYASIREVLNQWSTKIRRPLSRVESFFENIWHSGGKEIRVDRVGDEYKYSFKSNQGTMGGKLSAVFLNSLEEYLDGGERLLTLSDSERSKLVISEASVNDHSQTKVIKVDKATSDVDKCLSEEVRSKKTDVDDDHSRIDVSSKFSKDILIVEDDLNFSQSLAGIVESKGYSVCCVFSVEEFEQCVAMSDLQIRLVISDYRLGGRNGGDIIKVCRALPDPIPVIFLTEDSDPKTEASMIQLGTQAFVRKSTNPMILLAWISRLLDNPRTKLTPGSQSIVLQ